MSTASLQRVAAFLLLATLASPLAADGIKDELDAARKLHQDTTEKADAALLAGFDEQVKAVAATGNIDEVKIIIEQKGAFKATRKRPASGFMKGALARYDQTIKSSNAALISAHEKSIADYTKALKVDDAGQVKAQLAQFKAGLEGKTDKPDETAAPAGADAVLATLQRAKSDHADRLEESRKDYLEVVEKRLKLAVDKGDLAGVKSLGETKEQFRISGVPPEDAKDPLVKSAGLQYLQSVKLSKAKLAIAYQGAVRDYTRLGKTTEAEVLQTDLLALREVPASSVDSGEKQGSRFAPKDAQMIADDEHVGRATNHPSYTRGNLYIVKIDAKQPLVKIAETSIYFLASQPEDKANTKGNIMVSADYGKTWTKAHAWTGESMKAAKRQDNWHFFPLAASVRKLGKVETDELHVKFEVDGTVEEIQIQRVVWTRR